MSDQSRPSGNRFAFATVTSLFFMWGFITCLNDLLIPKFKTDFDLNQLQANTVQFAFFGAYFLISLIYFLISASKGDPINKIGYKNGLVLGLLIAGIGCILFYPAAQVYKFWFFLVALGVLGAGVTIIQIAANPYVTILGPEKSGSSRLNLAQGFNSLGYVIAPFLGGILIFGSEVFDSPLLKEADSKAIIVNTQNFLTESDKAIEGLTGENKESLAATKTIQDTIAESCLLYTSPSPRDQRGSRMPSSA